MPFPKVLQDLLMMASHSREERALLVSYPEGGVGGLGQHLKALHKHSPLPVRSPHQSSFADGNLDPIG